MEKVMKIWPWAVQHYRRTFKRRWDKLAVKLKAETRMGLALTYETTRKKAVKRAKGIIGDFLVQKLLKFYRFQVKLMRYMNRCTECSISPALTCVAKKINYFTLRYLHRKNDFKELLANLWDNEMHEIQSENLAQLR
jgi:uncharacterized membrane protein YheB (UPF0754 family)